jgi:hypothetical protein
MRAVIWINYGLPGDHGGTDTTTHYLKHTKFPKHRRSCPQHVSGLKAMIKPQLSRVIFVSAAGEWGQAMTDFLKGASWGAWFVLAGIIAAGLWAFVH